jgi:rare lipoprotein A
MARRHVFSFALAVFAASTVHAAPALELSGGLAAAPSQSPVSVQAFLQRIRQPVAAAPAAASAAGGYVPRTAHDNSPYRFDMTQNGRRMTAEEFDAWMKARGIRVATGKPAGSEPAAAAPAAATAQACQPTATTSC